MPNTKLLIVYIKLLLYGLSFQMDWCIWAKRYNLANDWNNQYQFPMYAV